MTYEEAANIEKVSTENREKPTSQETVWASSIESCVVVSEKEGIVSGTVNRIFLDCLNKTISALGLKTSVPGEDYYVNGKDITAIGRDVAFIKENKSVSPIRKLNDRRKNDTFENIKGSRVTTLRGKVLGELSDLGFDQHTLHINQLAMTSGHSIFFGGEQITIGEDEILVPPEFESKMVQAPTLTRRESNGPESYGMWFWSNLTRVLGISIDKKHGEPARTRKKQ